MIEKGKAPIQIFVVFEKIKVNLLTTESYSNSFYINIPKKWLYTLNIFFKNELTMSESSLIDLSAFDSINYKNLKSNINFFFKKNNIIIFYLYYFYFLKIKIIISVFYNIFKKENVKSIDNLYFNSNWLEREAAEMFGINYFFKKDLRKLLTDYSNIDNPLLKSYPTEGFNDIFYNFFEDQVIFNSNNSIEL
jgi:NADH:ubiquinone oxidoreductase subunit C